MKPFALPLAAGRSRPWTACVAVVALALGGGNALAQDDDDFFFDEEPVETVPVEDPTEPRQPAAADIDAEDPAPARPGATELGTVQVTGSRLRRTDFETAQPVLSISREDIERTGLTSLGDLLQRLPIAGPALNTTFNNGGDGSTQVDLRTLGPQRVLVLVNGRRWVGHVGPLASGNVDLNTVPTSIIERIEILKDGASAIYGSDAIAGVINIITRTDFQGAEAGAFLSTTDQGDGTRTNFDFSVGNIGTRTTAFFNLSYTEEQAIGAGDRVISAVPLFGMPEGNMSRGASPIPGRTVFVPNQANANALGTGATNRSVNPATGEPFRCFELAGSIAAGAIGVDPIDTIIAPGAVAICDLFRAGPLGDPGNAATGFPGFIRNDVNLHSHNFAPDNFLLTPQERTAGFATLQHQITPGIAFQGEFLINKRKSRQLLAPMPLLIGDLLPEPFGLIHVDADAAFNPFNQDIGRGDPATGLIGLGAVIRRAQEAGFRVFTQDVDTSRVGGAFVGDLDLVGRFWNWDAGYVFTESRQTEIREGLFSVDRMIQALGPAGDCTDPCVPLDLFSGYDLETGEGTLTQEMLDWISVDLVNTAKQRQRHYFANVSAMEVLPLPAGPLGLAFGVEHRDIGMRVQPDPLTASGRALDNVQTPTVGSFDITDAYVEFGVPLVRDMPFVRELELSIAGRTTSSNFGDKQTGKLGLRYKPIDDLLVRGTLSEAFRAPSITNLFLGRVQSFPALADPCGNWGESDNENVRANCAADGVPEDHSQPSSQLPGVFGGNPDLDAETATSFTAGIVWSPEFVPDFNLYVDYFRITIEDALQVPGFGNILNLCYLSDPGSRSLCEFVERGPSGAITQIENVFANFTKLDVVGWDFGFDYTLPIGRLLDRDVGRLQFIASTAYIHRRDLVSPGIGPEGQVVDQRNQLAGAGFGDGSVPRLRGQYTLLWSMGPFNASWTAEHISRLFEVCDDGLQVLGGLNPTEVGTLVDFGMCSHPEGGERPSVFAEGTPLNKLGSTIYHDVQFGYRLPFIDGMVAVGARNIFGKNPPVSMASFANSFDSTIHRLPDVQPYARVRVNF